MFLEGSSLDQGEADIQPRCVILTYGVYCMSRMIICSLFKPTLTYRCASQSLDTRQKVELMNIYHYLTSHQWQFSYHMLENHIDISFF